MEPNSMVQKSKFKSNDTVNIPRSWHFEPIVKEFSEMYQPKKETALSHLIESYKLFRQSLEC